jgi:hypothetical protein
MQQLGLGGDLDQGLVNHFGCFGSCRHQLPLRRGGHGHAKMVLPFVGAIHELAHPKALEVEHDPAAGIVFARPGLGRSGGGEESSTQSTTQPFQFKDRGVKDGLGGNAVALHAFPWRLEADVSLLKG